MKQILTSFFLSSLLLGFSITPAIGGTQYNLLNSHNYDFGPYKNHLGAKRTQYDIEVPENTSDEKVRQILNLAIEKLKNGREVDALSIRLFLKGGKSPYAIAEWSPYGDWGKAEAGTPKSVFKVTIKIYKNRRLKKELKKGKEIIITRDTGLSRLADAWGEEFLVTKVKKDTPAVILEVDDWGMGLARLKIKAIINGKEYIGWVHSRDIQE